MTEADGTAGPGTEKALASPPARVRSRGELVVDILLVLGIAWYLYVAQSYPPDGRQIPTVVGTVGLIAAVIQLAGWFIPGLWLFTHGDRPAGRAIHGARPDTAASTGGHAPTAPDRDAGALSRESRDTVVIMAWAAFFLAAILVLGYVYGVPLFFLAYFGARRSWKLAIGSAVAMWALTQLVFIDLLAIPLPGGAWL
ncbi:MAG TPA: tripartite tricarboxylate transporter TctB family protein [Trebonia sp.]